MLKICFESQIPVITEEFELRISCIQGSYLTQAIIVTQAMPGQGSYLTMGPHGLVG